MKKTKSFIYCLVFFLICILFLFFILYSYTTKQLSTSLSVSAENQLNYAYQRLEEKSSEIELLSASIMMENDIRYFSKRLDDDTNQYEYVQNLKRIKEMIRQRVDNSSGVESIHLYWPDNKLLISTKAGFSIEEDIIQYPIKDGEQWVNINDQLYFFVTYPYIQKDAQPIEFIIFAEVKKSFLNDIRQSVTSLENSKAFLVLPNGYIMYESSVSDSDIIHQANNNKIDLKINNKKIRVLSKTSPKNNVKIVSYYDSGNLLKPIFQINFISFIATSSVLLIGLVLIFIFYKNIFKKINVLINQFRNVENGNLEIITIEKSNSEFDYVFEQFNQMISGINKLLYSLEKEYHLRDLAERKQLQSQINPHFLYNTLFYIVSMADDAEAVREMTMHVADYYQYRTNTKDLVLLDEEIEFAQSYLSIIALRKQINYKIDMNCDVSEIEILPLLIQPLLENAIQHGIDEKEGAFQVALLITNYNNSLSITVSDDGNGLRQDEIDELLVTINQTNASVETRVGLRNINQRLINYYGKQSALKIEMDQNLGGLKVSFKIPKGGLI